MDYIRRACQLKFHKLLTLIVTLFFVASCSAPQKKEDELTQAPGEKQIEDVKSKKETSTKLPEEENVERMSDLPVVEPIPQWLNVDRRFAPRLSEGDPHTHAFFDFLPFPEYKDRKINFVAITPLKSRFFYGLDLHSGQIYKKYNLCEQSDVWKSYRGNISTPPYTIGIVPRILDQLGDPLKIVVFGGLKYFPKYNPRKPLSQRVKVVGGVIEQYCEYYPCSYRNQWMSRLVLVAINDKDPKFAKVDSLSDLKKIMKWNKFKANMENLGGRLIRGQEQKPAFRISGSVNAEDAFNYALTKGTQFKFDQLASLRKGCHKLYDHLWRGSLKLRKNISKGLSRRQLNKLRSNSLVVDMKKSIFKDDIKDIEKVEKDLAEDDGAIEGFANFDDYFMDFYSKYSRRYLTCHRFVRVSSVRGNIDRHWFFSYLTAFMQLERIGYVYHCPRRAWVQNPFLANGKRQFNPARMKKNCSSEDLERAFDGAVTILQGLRKSLLPHYFYKQYDHGIGGTHQRIYSWIFSNGKMPACQAELKKVNKQVGFPNDVTWKPFHPYTLDI